MESKVCNRCKESLPIDSFNRRTKSLDGRAHMCKICNKKYGKEHYHNKRKIRKIELPDDFKKLCQGVCKQIKHKSEFYSNPGTADQLTDQCKECLGPQLKKYRKSESGRKSHNLKEQEYRLKYPLRYDARAAIGLEVRSKRMPKVKTLKCVYCDKQAGQYHHWSYFKENWYNVEPVCTLHHSFIDNPKLYKEQIVEMIKQSKFAHLALEFDKENATEKDSILYQIVKEALSIN